MRRSARTRRMGGPSAKLPSPTVLPTKSRLRGTEAIAALLSLAACAPAQSPTAGTRGPVQAAVPVAQADETHATVPCPPGTHLEGAACALDAIAGVEAPATRCPRSPGSPARWSADAGTEENRVVAGALYDDGLAAETGGDANQACDKYARAVLLSRLPTALSKLAACNARRGALLVAAACYRELKAMSLPVDAPTAYVEAQANAFVQLDAVSARLARLRVALEPLDGAAASVDGFRVTLADLGAGVALDPGAHRVVATAPGRRPAVAETTIAEGETRALTLALDPWPLGAELDGAKCAVAPCAGAAPRVVDAGP
jgi:hypothetical protein